jgi:hypothetical protein
MNNNRAQPYHNYIQNFIYLCDSQMFSGKRSSPANLSAPGLIFRKALVDNPQLIDWGSRGSCELVTNSIASKVLRQHVTPFGRVLSV